MVEPALEICTRCFWVWLDAAGLDHFAKLRPASGAGHEPARIPESTPRDSSEARREIARLAAECLEQLFP